MKLAILKLISLLVLAAGVVIVGFYSGCDFLQENLPKLRLQVGECVGPDWKMDHLITIVAALMIAAGLYGFLPRLFGRKRTITYSGENGDVLLELKPAERTLVRVLKQIPEVKKIHVRLTPDKSGQLARVEGDLRLQNVLESPARNIHDLINRYIIETATNMLGIDVERPIKLRIHGTDINAKTASQALRANALPSAPAEEMRMPVVSEEEPIVLPEPVAVPAAEPEPVVIPEPVVDVPAAEPVPEAPPADEDDDLLPPMDSAEDAPSAEPEDSEATGFSALSEEAGETAEEGDEEKKDEFWSS